MEDKLKKILSTQSFESFKQEINNLPERDCLKQLSVSFFEPHDCEYIPLSYLIFKQAIPDLEVKFLYILQNLSKFKEFNLPEYLNSYRGRFHVIGQNIKTNETPLYLLAIFYKSEEIMQYLFDYGCSPDVVMKDINGFDLDGSIISQGVDGSGDKALILKHNELKCLYLKNFLSTKLGYKHTQKNIKI